MSRGVDLQRVFRLRDRLARALSYYCGTELAGPVFWQAVGDLSTCLPADVPRGALADSARLLLAGTLDQAKVFAFAWRLAGNLGALRSGHSIGPWRVPESPSWEPARFESVRRTRTRSGDAASVFRVRFLAGPTCPEMIDKFWTNAFLPVLARALGFPPPWKDGHYCDPAELVRLRFRAEIDAAHCRDGRPGFERVRLSPSDTDWNRSLLRARAREETPCPRDYDHPCFRCPVGYAECPAGTHPRTYTFGACAGCRREAPHDPGDPSGLCLACAARATGPSGGRDAR